MWLGREMVRLEKCVLKDARSMIIRKPILQKQTINMLILTEVVMWHPAGCLETSLTFTFGQWLHTTSSHLPRLVSSVWRVRFNVN